MTETEHTLTEKEDDFVSKCRDLNMTPQQYVAHLHAGGSAEPAAKPKAAAPAPATPTGDAKPMTFGDFKKHQADQKSAEEQAARGTSYKAVVNEVLDADAGFQGVDNRDQLHESVAAQFKADNPEYGKYTQSEMDDALKKATATVMDSKRVESRAILGQTEDAQHVKKSLDAAGSGAGTGGGGGRSAGQGGGAVPADPVAPTTGIHVMGETGNWPANDETLETSYRKQAEHVQKEIAAGRM